MTTPDIVKRLRRDRKVWVNGSAMTYMRPDDVYRDLHDAADEIERLRDVMDFAAAKLEFKYAADPVVLMEVRELLRKEVPADGDNA